MKLLDPILKNGTIEVEPVKIRDQGECPSCWLHSYVSSLENTQASRTGRKEPLSVEYLYSQYLYEIALKAISQDFSEVQDKAGHVDFILRERLPKLFTSGSDVEVAAQLASQHGLVPDAHFEPAWKAHSGNETELMERARGIIREYYVEWLRIRREAQNATIYAEDPDEREMEMLTMDLSLGSRLQDLHSEFVQRLRILFFGGRDRSPMFYGKDGAERPQNFAIDFMDGHRNGMRRVSLSNGLVPAQNQASGAPGTANVVEGRQSSVVKTHEWRTPEKMEKVVLAALRRGVSVPASFAWVDSLVNRKTGAIRLDPKRPPTAPQAFDEVLELRKQSAERFKDELQGASHAVSIVGVTLKRGRVVEFKLQNSHGEKSGDGGVFHMDAPYFYAFLNFVYLPFENWSELVSQ